MGFFDELKGALDDVEQISEGVTKLVGRGQKLKNGFEQMSDAQKVGAVAGVVGAAAKHIDGRQGTTKKPRGGQGRRDPPSPPPQPRASTEAEGDDDQADDQAERPVNVEP